MRVRGQGSHRQLGVVFGELEDLKGKSAQVDSCWCFACKMMTEGKFVG